MLSIYSSPVIGRADVLSVISGMDVATAAVVSVSLNATLAVIDVSLVVLDCCCDECRSREAGRREPLTPYDQHRRALPRRARSMIPKTPAPDLVRGGCGFSEKIISALLATVHLMGCIASVIGETLHVEGGAHSGRC